MRRCHGDLHLGNIVLWQGRPVLFDAIEFDEKIATIDTLYDLAFLIMDLDRHRQGRAANAVYSAPHERSAIEAAASDLGIPFRGLWLTAAGEELAARVAARRNDASDATPEFVARQLIWDIGTMSSAWATLDAGGDADETLRRAMTVLDSWAPEPHRPDMANNSGEAP